VHGSTSAAESPELETLTLLAARAQSATRGYGMLDAAARENLERALRAAIDDMAEMAPAHRASPQYCSAGEALASLHLSLHSERLMGQVGSIGPLGAIRASGTAGAGSGSSTFEGDDATLS
jgi:hypothetical protein